MPDVTQEAPLLVGVGSIFIDDVVQASGETRMGQLGGGVTHAMMGAALWGERPGLIALAGTGLPDEALAFLSRHCDLSGLHMLDQPQARWWQLFEHDGSRRELARVDDMLVFELGPRPERLPPEYETSGTFYVITDFEGIIGWRQATSARLLWEPLQQIMISANSDLFRQTLGECGAQIVSPNLKEARAIYGELSAEALVNAMLADGAEAVALRMGEDGSIVADAAQGMHHIPALPVPRIIDQTGAGNTYCGALALGMAQGRELAEAGCMGAVSASFCLETYGTVDPDHVHLNERDRRWRQIQSLLAS